MRRAVGIAALTFFLSACRESPPQALGTLEYDRISLAAPAAERIVSLDVHEGDRVRAGERIAQLEAVRGEANLRSAQAQVERERQSVDELEAGARAEEIEQARGRLAATQARAREAAAFAARLEPLGRRQLVAAADVDRARAAAADTRAQAQAAQAALDELLNGTRGQTVAQGRAALAASQAQAELQQVTLQKLGVVSPRDGLVDSLPYREGDDPAPGSPLAILLVGDAPFARVYVPEPLRTRLRVGSAARVHVEGRTGELAGKIRMIRSAPSFTPYYALAGDDAARLSYVAEIALERGVGSGLPAGLPVQVDFDDAPR